MEENDLIILKNSKKHIVKAGKWMNVFSIFLSFSVLFLVAGGILILFVSGTLDEATPYYLDNVLGIIGILCILFATALLPAIVCMRRAVHAADQVRINNDLMPSVGYLVQLNHLWHYLMLSMVVGFIIAIAAAVVALVIYWPQFNMMFDR